MWILAFDTSTEWCSVAVGDGARWHVRDEHADQAHAECLLPMVRAALADAGLTLARLDGLAFGAGPGSFTGVRIGCSVAQGLALGAHLPVVPVPTLEAIAQGVLSAHGWTRVLACLDARMREVYVAAHAHDGGVWRCIAPPAVLAPADVRLPVDDIGGGSVATDWCGAGAGFAAYPALAERLGLRDIDVEARPAARAVGELALSRLAAGEGVAAADALPLYVRHRVALTTAERSAGLRL